MENAGLEHRLLSAVTAATTERSPPGLDQKLRWAFLTWSPRRRWRPVPIKASIAVIDLAGVRSLGAAEIRLGLCWIATLRVPNIGAGAHFLLRDKDPRQSNSGFQPVMKLIQEILDFFAIIVLKELHA